MAADLEAADQHRKELVANVSHELRTPIAALRAVLENVVDGVSDADPETMRTALKQTERLGRLVEHLLDLSRLDNGVVPLHARRFEVWPYLSGVLKEANMVASARAGIASGSGSHTRTDVHLHLDVSPPELTAHADPERLHQVVANLIDNAVKHSPPHGRVTVQARRGDGPRSPGAGGPGRGPRHPRVGAAPGLRAVQPRRRAGRRTGRGSDGGTGLGLAIARWAVDLHGGRIGVAESARGCRIQVTLPGLRRCQVDVEFEAEPQDPYGSAADTRDRRGSHGVPARSRVPTVAAEPRLFPAISMRRNPLFECDLHDDDPPGLHLRGHGGVAFIPAVHHLVKRKRAVAAVSPQSPSSSSISTDQDGQGKNPAAAFGPNEWLVDEIYQQYLQDPNSVDRAWWDFFADYKPGGRRRGGRAGTRGRGGRRGHRAAAAPAAPAAPAPAAPPAAASPRPPSPPPRPPRPRSPPRRSGRRRKAAPAKPAPAKPAAAKPAAAAGRRPRPRPVPST